jgi:hypothetical protein
MNFRHLTSSADGTEWCTRRYRSTFNYSRQRDVRKNAKKHAVSVGPDIRPIFRYFDLKSFWRGALTRHMPSEWRAIRFTTVTSVLLHCGVKQSRLLSPGATAATAPVAMEMDQKNALTLRWRATTPDIVHLAIELLDRSRAALRRLCRRLRLRCGPAFRRQPAKCASEDGLRPLFILWSRHRALVVVRYLQGVHVE